MSRIELTFREHIPNENIKIGDVFHGIYEVVTAPKQSRFGYEWKVCHKRWNVDLRMLRPEPSYLLDRSGAWQESFVSAYQRNLVPMQLHPRIEAFYDVRHIGGSAAMFTELTSRSSLADRIADGSLYQGSDDEVYARLLRISAQTARALQYIRDCGIFHGDVCPESVMLTDRWNAKLSVAASLCGKLEDDDMFSWGMTVLRMYLGRLEIGVDEILDDYPGCKKRMVVKIPEPLERCALASIIDKLPSWQNVFLDLQEPLTREYPKLNGCYLNNRALRLADVKKYDDALRTLEDSCMDDADAGNPAAENLRRLRDDPDSPLILCQIDRWEDEI